MNTPDLGAIGTIACPLVPFPWRLTMAHMQPAKTIKIRCRMTDLWADGDGGWSENAANVTERVIQVPADASDVSCVRAIKRALGIQGWRRDDWCAADFGPWRDGTMGAYADVEC